MQGLEVKMLWGKALSAWTYILPHGVAGQLACHSPVTCWRCETLLSGYLEELSAPPEPTGL
jgi:hypothetical protein